VIRALLARTITDARWLFAAICALMFFFPVLFIWASGMISLPAFSDFLSRALPQDWQRIWGVPISEVATPAGRVALLYVHPLIISGALVWTITRGSDCVSGEIGRGSMEMLLAQPVRRTSVYATHAVVTVLGSALLALAVWLGTAAGLYTASLYDQVALTLYVPAATNLFALMLCLGGMAALASSFDSQRWRTIGIMVGFYVFSATLAVAGNISQRWAWWNFASFMTAYKPQRMVSEFDAAWSLLAYRDGQVVGIGLGGCQILLFLLGLIGYCLGALVFSRREIPAPI